MVLIGCGMRREDSFLYQLLWQFLGPKKRIVIVDPDACELAKRIERTCEYDLAPAVHPIEKTLESGLCDLVSELTSRRMPKTPAHVERHSSV